MLGSTMSKISKTLSMNGRSRVYVSSHGFSSEPSVLGS
jgi:hypothetical protein